MKVRSTCVVRVVLQTILLTGLFSLLLVRSAAAVPLVNGGFELPALPLGNFQVISPGTEPPGFGWTVNFGSVDVSHQPNAFVLYDAYEGVQLLDLNGNERGEIYQDFATSPGQIYQVSFAYTDNSQEGGTSTAGVRVNDVGGLNLLLNDPVSHSTATNGPPPNADWQIYTGSFQAIGLLSRLTFTSTSPSNSPSGGIVLDAVSVTNVPEPASATLLSLGLLGLAAWRVRRRNTTRVVS